ncbi:MAG: VanZ family protein [Flavobacterium sp.]
MSLISLGNIEQTLDKIDISNKDKYVHFTFYFVFVVLWFLQIKNKPIDRKTQIIILLSAIGYGIFMEICQGFTETRTPDIMDILANSTGAILGLLFISRIMNLKKTEVNK